MRRFKPTSKDTNLSSESEDYVDTTISVSTSYGTPRESVERANIFTYVYAKRNFPEKMLL